MGVSAPRHRAGRVGVGLLCVGVAVWMLGFKSTELPQAESMRTSVPSLDQRLVFPKVVVQTGLSSASGENQPVQPTTERVAATNAARASGRALSGAEDTRLAAQAHPYFPNGIELSPEQESERTLGYLATLISVAEVNTQSQESRQLPSIEPYLQLFSEAAATQSNSTLTESSATLQYFDAATIVWVDALNERNRP